jgi:hypothetical protein
VERTSVLFDLGEQDEADVVEDALLFNDDTYPTKGECGLRPRISMRQGVML